MRKRKKRKNRRLGHTEAKERIYDREKIVQGGIRLKDALRQAPVARGRHIVSSVTSRPLGSSDE
ncbi:hypothetical protein E2C01_029613 [Portunus trituberculatus]|uniref:Uncharacterized protein n=1 Tax=Portunus trituberculatus TaxID=210409 RepID=A0A5B7ERX4_PORTR|nr:hypothetical protein [Portunus trituberculatus]